VWKQGWQRHTIDGFNFFDLSDPIFLSYAAGIFVLGFLWVPSAIVAADLAVGGVRMARRAPARAVPGADPSRLAFLTVLTAALTYLLTSFRTWSNLRYFALLYPLLVILAFAALLRLGASARVRGAVFATIVALFAVAAFRSADPVSRAVYGTFPIGERVMYRMASITGEYAGPGRDELVYNLEFTGYHYVQDALYGRLRPSDSTVVIAPSLVRWSLWSPLDSASFERTLLAERSFSPRYGDEASLARQGDPREVWFLEFSNHPDKDATLETLQRTRYRETGTERVAARGHVLVAHHLVRREPQVLP
jgi:hypothetical protein